MAFRTRLGLILGIAVTVALSSSLTARQQLPQRLRPARPDFDVRAQRWPAIGSPRARAELRRTPAARNRRGSRLNPHTGALRVLERPGWTVARGALPAALRNQLVQAIDRLGLDDVDLESVRVLRDYVSGSTGLRHVTFAQSFDGIAGLRRHPDRPYRLDRRDSAGHLDGRSRRRPSAQSRFDSDRRCDNRVGRCEPGGRAVSSRCDGVARLVRDRRRPAARVARRARARRTAAVLRCPH